MVPLLGTPREFNRYGYSDAFLCFADDINRDGASDLVVVGFPGQKTHWLENPGRAGETWKQHLAVLRTGNESPAYVDVDGDGQCELVFMDSGRCVLARPGADCTQPWNQVAISAAGDPAPGHGLGVGDVNSDGYSDVVVPLGWWEQPTSESARSWQFHAAALTGGAQMCVEDLDQDGDQDILGASPHGYGIAWNEQTEREWQVHEIDARDSQTHAIHLADIDGDRRVDFVTGKRFWAHNGHDPGSFEPAVLCWYRQVGKSGRPQWTKHTLDYDSGVGLHFQIVDVNGDGLLDIVTANKKGVFYFEQRRY
jgi:hypothetical protein